MSAVADTALRPQRSASSFTLNLMRLRTFIALVRGAHLLLVRRAEFPRRPPIIVLMSKHVALNAFLAIGMTFVIITGGIDLSVGSIVGLCGMVAGGLILHGIDLPIRLHVCSSTFPRSSLIRSCARDVLIGLVNGLLITRLNVAPFIATLGTLYVARGAALLLSDGATFPNLEGKSGVRHDGLRVPRRRHIFCACRFRSGS